jgi:methylmalonyl-CoA mutase
LSEIAENNRKYDEQAREQRKIAQRMYALSESIQQLKESGASAELLSQLEVELAKVSAELLPKNRALVEGWSGVQALYQAPEYVFKVRDKELRMATHTESLSHTQVPKISTPRYEAWGDLLHWQLQENVPGEFPYTAGIYPFKREGEDPTRMFAGEGGPERTN